MAAAVTMRPRVAPARSARVGARPAAAAGLALALREDPARAGALTGFDAIALRVPTRDGIKEWVARLDRLDEPHGDVVTGHGGGSVLVGVHDPDGIEIRLYAD